MAKDLSGVVDTHPTVKERFRPFFVALHSAAMNQPGGITGMARVMGRNAQVVVNQLNPNSPAIPPAEVVLCTLELAHAVEALNALAWLMGRATVPVHGYDRHPREVMAGFLDLMQRASAATQAAAEGLGDGRLDHDEREALLPLLDLLIASAVEFRAVVQS